MSEIELSFCIPVMNRLEDLKATLAQNLEDNRDSHGRIEFIILCFDSDDQVESWINNNFQNDLNTAFLRFYRSSELEFWHFGRAKNAFKKLMNGRIYASLDGDNFTGFRGGEHIINVFKGHDYNCIFHQFQGSWGDGTCGRVSLSRDDYIKIGYDDYFLPRQWDELDAMLSVMVQNPERKYVCYREKSITQKSHPFKRFLDENNIYPEIVEIDEVLDPLYKNCESQAANKHDNNYVQDDTNLKLSSIFNHLLSFFKNTNIDELRNKYVAELQEVQRDIIDTISSDILEKWTLDKQCNKNVFVNQDDILLLSCIKDESDLIEWYQHYKILGVTKFLLIDDYSRDPVAQILNQEDVYVWSPIVGTFRHAKVFWLEILLSRYCQNSWCITVDSDEHLSLPDFPQRNSDNRSPLTRYIDVGLRKGIGYFCGFLLDVFPSADNYDKCLSELSLSDFSFYQFRPSTLSYLYKQSNTVKWSYGDSYSWAYQIDVRYRLNRAFDSLRKFPLFKYRLGFHLNQGFHDLIIDGEKRKPNELERYDLIPIIHYKLKSLLIQKLTRHKKNPKVYHPETCKNLLKLLCGIKICINNAMLSPFAKEYLGYVLIPVPACNRILIENVYETVNNIMTRMKDEECVDRYITKLIFVRSNKEPYLHGYYIYGRSFSEVVDWIKINTPFYKVEFMNETSAMLISW